MYLLHGCTAPSQMLLMLYSHVRTSADSVCLCVHAALQVCVCVCACVRSPGFGLLMMI